MSRKILNIYLVEDSLSRVKYVEKYFENVNKLLNGEGGDYEDSHLVFAERGFDEVKVMHIDSGIANGEYIDYIFGEQEQWVKQIGSIMKQSEERVFIIDLVLNENERKEFAEVEDVFRAQTAKQIIRTLKAKNERIIVESIMKDLVNQYKRMLDMVEGEECLITLRSEVFSDCFSPELAVKCISNAFDTLLE